MGWLVSSLLILPDVFDYVTQHLAFRFTIRMQFSLWWLFYYCWFKRAWCHNKVCMELVSNDSKYNDKGSAIKQGTNCTIMNLATTSVGFYDHLINVAEGRKHPVQVNNQTLWVPKYFAFVATVMHQMRFHFNMLNQLCTGWWAHLQLPRFWVQQLHIFAWPKLRVRQSGIQAAWGWFRQIPWWGFFHCFIGLW